MDEFFDKIGDWIKTLLNEPGGPKTYDPDFSDAWEELESYLNYGPSLDQTERGFSAGNVNETKTPAIPAELRVHYEILGIDAHADLEEVKKAFKTLIRAHHPDKHAGNEEAQIMATDKTQKVVAAYAKISSYLKKGSL